jgi:hypothetical protein
MSFRRLVLNKARDLVADLDLQGIHLSFRAVLVKTDGFIGRNLSSRLATVKAKYDHGYFG